LYIVEILFASLSKLEAWLSSLFQSQLEERGIRLYAFGICWFGMVWEKAVNMQPLEELFCVHNNVRAVEI
ncbi:unnamed protein product, partial [Urochloa humidicola]